MLTTTRTTLATLIIVATSSSFCAIWLLRRYANRYHRRANNYQQIPSAWKQIGRITELVIYPLKSAYRLSVEQAYCDDKGLRMVATGSALSDRCFVLLDRSRGKYISNHFHDHLIRVKVAALNESAIQFSVHNDSSIAPLILNMKQLNESSSRCVHTIRMYELDQVRALDCGDEASNWFSQYLTGSVDNNIRLGYDYDEQRRLNGTIYEKYHHFYGSHISNEDMGKFSYLASYMVMNETSTEELNGRLEEKGESPVSIHNFRGNIILRTDVAYEEDDWTWLRLNSDVILRFMKPCTRCKMTCLDPETGVRNPSLQPLATLREYRGPLSEGARKLEGSSPRLGVYCGLYARGVVKVGDPVYVAAE